MICPMTRYPVILDQRNLSKLLEMQSFPKVNLFGGVSRYYISYWVKNNNYDASALIIPKSSPIWKGITPILLMSISLVSSLRNTDDINNVELEGKLSLTDISCFWTFGDKYDFNGHKLIFQGSILKIEKFSDFQFLVLS